MFWRRRKKSGKDRQDGAIHVSDLGELSMNANDIFATERVKKLLDQTSKIRPVNSNQKRDKKPTSNPANYL